MQLNLEITAFLALIVYALDVYRKYYVIERDYKTKVKYTDQKLREMAAQENRRPTMPSVVTGAKQ